MTRDERLLFTTGRVPLWVRIIVLPFLLMVILFFVEVVLDLFGWDPILPGERVAHSGAVRTVLGLLACAFLIWLFLGCWFWQSWILLDAARSELVLRNRGFFGIITEKRIPAGELKHIEVHYGVLKSRRFWDLVVIRKDGGEVWLTRHADPDREPADKLAEEIAAALGVKVKGKEE